MKKYRAALIRVSFANKIQRNVANDFIVKSVKGNVRVTMGSETGKIQENSW